MKWILVLILLSDNGSNRMLVYPDTFAAQHECKEAGNIWTQQASRYTRFVCLPSYTRPD